eukprot:2881720-Prymnesium_polylepis.1
MHRAALGCARRRTACAPSTPKALRRMPRPRLHPPLITTLCSRRRYGEEEDEGDEQLNLVLARQAQKQQRMAQDGPEEPSDPASDLVAAAAAASALSTHKRKGVPIKSLPPAKSAPQWHNHEGQMKMLQEQVHACGG